MMDETYIDGGGRPEAAVNEENLLKHFILLECTILNVGDTMALVSSSRSTIYRSKVVSK